MRITPLAAFAFVLAVAPAQATNMVGDLDLLASGAVPPNVMIVLDNSGSMQTALGGSTRTEVARDAMLDLIEDLYPDDGSGGYTASVRLGLAVFDTNAASSHGGEIAVPIADDNKQALIDEVNDVTTFVLGGGTWTPLSETLVDVGRYFAGEHGFGSYPAVANTSPIDLECRENFVLITTDGEPTRDLNDLHGSSVSGTTAHSDFVNTIGNADVDGNECDAAFPATCIDGPSDGRDDGQTYSNDGTDWLDDVAYHLANADLSRELERRAAGAIN